MIGTKNMPIIAKKALPAIDASISLVSIVMRNIAKKANIYAPTGVSKKYFIVLLYHKGREWKN
jgi:hypothetical protein